MTCTPLDITPRSDLKRLTGLEKPSAIRRFLTRQHIPFIVGADGWPRVLNVVIVERLGGQVQPPTIEPELILD